MSAASTSTTGPASPRERSARPAGRSSGRRSRAGGWTALALLIGLTAVGGYVSRRAVEGPACPVGRALVVLDPGHGGEDPGAVNEPYGLVERDLNLEISRRATALLNADGLSVALTRADNATLLTQSERGLLANACRALLYVSVHLNSFGEPDPNYVKTFWGAANKDLAFAQTMQAALAAELRPGTDLGDSGVEQLENGGLLRARMPAALIEPVFLSNPDEAARLAAPGGARLDQIALAIARGVEAWLGIDGAAVRSASRDGGRGFMRPTDALLADPRGTPEQVIAAAGAAGAIRLDDLRAYVGEVYRLAPLVGLDPAIVVAQSAHETGFWRSEIWVEHLNPAGIGVTGPGVPSPSWTSGENAARAQIVHLYLYAAGEIPAGHLLAPYLALDPRYEAARSAGRAASSRTIADLTGRWATDPLYADGVARVGSQLFAAD